MQSEKSNSVFFNKIQRFWELLRTACIFLSPLSIPLIAIVLILFYVYRCLVMIVLKIQLRNKFAGFLESSDCVWAIEDVSLSVINILMIMEKAAQNSNTIFLEDFRKLINDHIVSKAAGTTLEKLLYLRSQKFGYYFWERSAKIDLKNRIRWLECVNANCDGSCEDISSESFRKMLGNVCNKSLPEDHKATWEFLVGKRCPKFKSHAEESHLSPEECFNTDSRKIPLVFRVHHSLGDGIAITNLLLQTIMQKDETKEMKVEMKSITSSSGETGEHAKEIVPALRNSENNLQNEKDIVQFCVKDAFIASIPTYIMFTIVQNLRNWFHEALEFHTNAIIDSLKQRTKLLIDLIWLTFKNVIVKQMYGRLEKVMRFTMILFFSPKFFIQQIIRSMDENNALHDPPQTGKKIVFYWAENNATDNKSQNLLTKIRKIRKNTGAKFEDVVLAAFSASIHKYCLYMKKPIPDAITAIFPIRLSMPDCQCPKNLTLNNDFSVVLLQICIASANGQAIVEPNRDSQFFKRLQHITRVNNEIRKSPNILINFWVMKYLSALLPVIILKTVVSSYSTIGFSNMCGSKKACILNNSVSNVFFWIPHRGTTALGFCLLSYADKLHLSLIVDESIVNDKKSFMELLENTVHEIDTAYNNEV